MKFIKRLTEPTKDNKYFFEDNFFKGKYGMPNCTAYAWGRAYEIMGTKPDFRTRADGIGNAKSWFGSKYCPYERGQEPRLGAIMCFDGTYGHVAVVEEINGNSVTVSQSSYGGPMFSTRTYKKGNYDHGSLKFQGFIYLPITIDENTNCLHGGKLLENSKGVVRFTKNTNSNDYINYIQVLVPTVVLKYLKDTYDINGLFFVR